MKTQFSISAQQQNSTIGASIKQWLSKDNELMTAIMGESVTNKHTLLWANAFLSFILLCGTCAYSTLGIIFVGIYFATSIIACKEGGMK